MFSQPGNTSFGNFNNATQNSPFGQSAFGKPISTTSFGTGTTAFGANNSSLFNAKPLGATTGGLFGSTATTPAFGQPATTQSTFSGFGNTTATNNLFGTQPTANTNLFAAPTSTSAFGQPNKPSGFGFNTNNNNNTTTTTNLFGQPQQTVQQTTPFGNTNTSNTNNLFASTGFRSATATGTGITGTPIKFNPVTGTDTMVKNGSATNITTRHYCIMCMKEYENKSLEELRLEDYTAGLKGPQQQQQQQQQQGQTTGLFGNPAQSSPFGNTSTMTGTSTGTSGFTMTSGFNQPTNNANSLFGVKPSTFGVPTTTSTSAFAFNPTTCSSIFGTQSKPFGVSAPTPLFPSTNTNQTPATGFNTMTNNQNTPFGNFATQPNQSIGLFNQKPTAFSMTPAANNNNFGFNQNTTTNTAGNLFAKPLNTGFNTGTTPFSSNSTFGTNQNANNTSLFNTSFKPNNPPNFSFGNTTVATTQIGNNTNTLTGNTSIFGQNKPVGLFNLPTASTTFNNTGTFGTTGAFGLGNTSTTTGLGMNIMGNSGIGGNQMQQNSSSTSSSSVPVHQQILALVSTPFGDSPLLKNLLPASGKTEELLKPTNSTSKNLNGSQFKISTLNNSPKIKTRVVTPVQLTKKSLFDGLEEEDPVLLEAFQPRANTKRLVLRQKRSFTNPNITNQDNGNASIDVSSNCSDDNDELIDKENNQMFTCSKSSWLKRKELNHQDGKSPFNASTDTSQDKIENTVAELYNPDVSNKKYLEKHKTDKSFDTLLADELSSRELDDSSIIQFEPEEEPNKAKVVLRRAGYYTIPPLDQLDKYINGDSCIVPNFTIGRNGYGNVYFSDSLDIYGLNLDEIVHFRHKEVTIYPDDEKKPKVGEGLNRRAQVTLDRVWPHDKNLHEPITDPQRLASMNYESKLRRVCAKHDMRFLEYRPETGSWVFKVDHFSKYGLSDSDDEDNHSILNPTAKKLATDKTMNQTNKKQLPANHHQHDDKDDDDDKQDKQDKNDKEINNLKNVESKEIKNESEKNILYHNDNDEDSVNDSEIYQEFNGDKSSAMSPTSVYARLIGTDSHKLQLMKASFFDDDNDDDEDDDDDNDNDDDDVDVDVDDDNNNDIDVDIDNSSSELLLKHFHHRESQKLNKTDLNQSHKTTLLKSNISFSSSNNQKNKSKKLIEEGKIIEQVSIMNKYFPPPIVKPVTRVLKFSGQVVPLKDSICFKLNFHTIADISIHMGRKFKANWGPGLTLVCLSTQEQASTVPLYNKFSQLETYVAGRMIDDNTSSSIVQRLQILGGNKVDSQFTNVFKSSIEQHLKIQLKYCTKGQENNVYWLRPGIGNAGISALHEHSILAQEIAANLKNETNETNDSLVSYVADVWKLCIALWGNLQDIELNSDKNSHDNVMIRREALSDWLKSVVEDTVQFEIAKIKDSEDRLILSLLTANKLEESCAVARKIGDYNLALLISQLGGSSSVKELLKRTIALWQSTYVVREKEQLAISIARLKIFMLVAGEQLISCNNDVINVCENLDWKRALAIHLWYLSIPTASITDILELYESSFNGDVSQIYAAPPLPDYKEEEFEAEILNGNKIYDLCYHLLKLYCTGNHPLEKLLNPLTHTSDPLDYRLSWLLQQIIVGLGYSHLSEHVAAITHVNFAAQLEAHDLWHWAIFVMLHLNNVATRKTGVIDLLSRHVQIDDNPEYIEREKFLTDQLGISFKWISEAKAIKACAIERYGEATWYLLQAELWNKAHEIIIQHLAADAIINENYQYLKSILNPLTPSECNSTINGWPYQGQLLWDYIQIAIEIESFLKNPDYSQIGYKLELVQPQLTSLCTKINQFPCPNAKLRLCQAEIAKRTLYLAKSLLMLQPDVEQHTANVLTRLVSQLPLPEDYAQQEIRPVVNTCVEEIFGH